MSLANARIPICASVVTMDEVDAYTAKTMEAGARRSALLARKQAAADAVHPSLEFGQHVLARVKLAIATERCDHDFAMQCWKTDSAETERRAAVVKHLKWLRKTARRARNERRALNAPAFKVAA